LQAALPVMPASTVDLIINGSLTTHQLFEINNAKIEQAIRTVAADYNTTANLKT